MIQPSLQMVIVLTFLFSLCHTFSLSLLLDTFNSYSAIQSKQLKWSQLFTEVYILCYLYFKCRKKMMNKIASKADLSFMFFTALIHWLIISLLSMVLKEIMTKLTQSNTFLYYTGFKKSFMSLHSGIVHRISENSSDCTSLNTDVLTRGWYT